MTLSQLIKMFTAAGAEKLFAKPLAENDNSKNQIYFAGTVEALNTFPFKQIYAENTKQGPSFKAELDFSWLTQTGAIAPAPHSKFILYAQYPEIRFSGFLKGCKAAPADLMMDRQRASEATNQQKTALANRVLFIAVTSDRKLIGYVAPGNSQIALEYKERDFENAFVVFKSIPLPGQPSVIDSQTRLLNELCRIHNLGWIDSKQLAANNRTKPCNAPQCGGFTLEAELGIPKNSKAEPDYLGWEIKQHSVRRFGRPPDSKAITLLTPEPDEGYYVTHGKEAFVRKFGYPDKTGKKDRINFGGRHFVDQECSATYLTMRLLGYEYDNSRIVDAGGSLALVSRNGAVTAAWTFKKLLEHWSKKHAKAVFVPSIRKDNPTRQYAYDAQVRLAVGTSPLHLLNAIQSGKVYYDPGIKLENATTKPKIKTRSQFRVASKNIGQLYSKLETVNSCDA